MGNSNIRLEDDGLPHDGVSHFSVTAEHLRTYARAEAELSRFRAPLLLERDNPHQRLAIAGFDGTQNDVFKDPLHATNVGRLKLYFDQNPDMVDSRIYFRYLEGPGTQDNAVAAFVDSANGFSYPDRLEKMYGQLVDQANLWHELDPDVDIRALSTGFSRGASQAGGFTNLLHERGIPDTSSRIRVMYPDGHMGYDYTRYLVRPGEILQAVALYDPVATGVPMDFNRQLPSSVVSGFQISAGLEGRKSFPADLIIPEGHSADGRFLNVFVAGAHSDVGGGYLRDGLSRKNFNLMSDYVNALSAEPFLPKVWVPDDPGLLVVHRSTEGNAVFRVHRMLAPADRSDDSGRNERQVPKDVEDAPPLPHRPLPAEVEHQARVQTREIAMQPVPEQVGPHGTVVLADEVHAANLLREQRLAHGSQLAYKGLGALGAAAAVYEGVETGFALKDLLQHDNATGAESRLVHFGGQSAGGWAGAVAGVKIGVVAGVESGPGMLVTGLVGGAVGAYAGDKLAAWNDDRKIYTQEDRYGRSFHFDPDHPEKGWLWTGVEVKTDPATGAPIVESKDFRAVGETERELNYKATSKSVELVLGNPPPPRDPFTQPVAPGEPVGRGSTPWTRDAQTGAWSRTVTDAFAERGQSLTHEERVDAAHHPERAAELDRQAAAVMRENVANSPAAIAARYERAYFENGWDRPDQPIPGHVTAELAHPEVRPASDGEKYRQREDGEWVRDGWLGERVAEGNVRMELSASQPVLIAALMEHTQSLAIVHNAPQPANDPDSSLREAVQTMYAGAKVEVTADQLRASIDAVKENNARTGVVWPYTVELQANAQGQITRDSPIATLQGGLDANGEMRPALSVVGVTTTQDLQRAYARLEASSPVPDASEHRIAQATPEERDARSQAEREVNRQGLSHVEVRQVVHGASSDVTAIPHPEPETLPQAQRERVQELPAATSLPQVAAVSMARDARDEGSARLERERADAELHQADRKAQEQVWADKMQVSEVDRQTATATNDREPVLSPEPERTAAKIESTVATERRNEPPFPNPSDDVAQETRTTTTSAPARDHRDVLRPGDGGDQVELLQYRLDRQGYLGPDGAPIPQTGQYGQDTEHAVRQFQTLHGLPATGVADQGTREAVDRALAAQRERERGEPDGPNRSTPAPETPGPVAAACTVGLSGSAGRHSDDKPEREPEPIARAAAQPETLAAITPDPTLAHRDVTWGERDDDRRPSADSERAPTAVTEQAQPAPTTLMTQPGHPAHGMYTQALSQIERGDVVPAGTLTQEEKSRLAAGVVAQFLAEDMFATRIDGVYASKHNAAGPGMPASLIPVQGNPTTDYCHRASVNVEQALQASIEQSSTIAQVATQARGQELTKQQERAQELDQDGPKGPTMRIGTRTLTQGSQGDGGGGDGGGGGD